jgi:hypothetical protein
LHSEYIELLKYNIDHFGEEAKLAYEAGHAVALETALRAYNEINPHMKIRILIQAFTQELFACHFLTDLFASGHIRTPRAALISHVHSSSRFHTWGDDYISKGVIAGFLAEAMHNEDNRLGLQVTSQAHKEPWMAFGDHCYFEDNEKINNDRMQETVKIALHSIAKVYFTGKIDNPNKNFDHALTPLDQCYNYRHYIPTPTVKNHPPLFMTDTAHKHQETPLINSRADNFFKQATKSSNILATKDKQLMFDRYEVLGDGECGYTAFGITRTDAYDLIKSKLNDVQNILLPVVKEALLSEKFINYLKEKGIANAALLAEYNKYKAAAEQGGNMSDSIIHNLYLKIDLTIIQGYIDYDIRDKKIDAGWPHPQILQVLAHIQEVQLFMWQIIDNEALIPHQQEEYAIYTPPIVTSRTDILFVNNNHFDRLQLRSDSNTEMDKVQTTSKLSLESENVSVSIPQVKIKPSSASQEECDNQEIRHLVLRRAKVHLKEGEVCHHIHDWSPVLLFMRTRPQKMIEEKWQTLRKQFEDKTAEAKNIIAAASKALQESASQSVTHIKEQSRKCSII